MASLLMDKMNELLIDIFEKYTKVELDRTIQCDYCIGRKRAPNASVKRDKPWFTEECKILCNSYKRALSIVNDIHSDENRMKLNLEKQKYKRLENKLKRLYKNKQGNMFNSMRTSNPKRLREIQKTEKKGKK
jgi:transcription elongation factor